MNETNIGIIAEFNPFHNGHKNLIEKIKLNDKNATIICAMSGNFVQRGELSIYDKWKRAEIALNAGVDLVIEIPPFYVLNNANIFAKESLKLLHSFNVNKIYFGSENLSVDDMTEIALLLISKKEELNKLKKDLHSLPKAFEKLIGKKINPNDLLGICYIMEAKKLNFNIKFIRIERIFDEQFQSASSIRSSLKKEMKFLELEDYSDVVIGKLITSDSNLDVIKYLKNIALKKSIISFDELIDKAANNSYTKSALRRELIKYTLQLKESKDKYIILALGNKGQNILKGSKVPYNFRHTKDSIENLKVETFISFKSKETLPELLGRKTIIKK